MEEVDFKTTIDKIERLGKISSLMDIKLFTLRKKDELDYKGKNEYDFCVEEGKLTAYNELLEYCDGLILKLKEENVTENKEIIT